MYTLFVICIDQPIDQKYPYIYTYIHTCISYLDTSYTHNTVDLLSLVMTLIWGWFDTLLELRLENNERVHLGTFESQRNPTLESSYLLNNLACKPDSSVMKQFQHVFKTKYQLDWSMLGHWLMIQSWCPPGYIPSHERFEVCANSTWSSPLNNWNLTSKRGTCCLLWWYNSCKCVYIYIFIFLFA